jgi:pilT domain-containing protein
MYLFDTNVISEIRGLKFGKCNIGVKEWFSTISLEQIYTNLIVMMELERGVLGMERKDPQQGEILKILSIWV